MSIVTLRRGDDATRTVTVTLNALPVDLETAQQVTFTAKRQLVDDDEDAALRFDLSDGLSLEGNVATITFPAAIMAGLEAPAILPFDVEVVDVEGLTATVAEGYLRIEPDVTREAVVGS